MDFLDRLRWWYEWTRAKSGVFCDAFFSGPIPDDKWLQAVPDAGRSDDSGATGWDDEKNKPADHDVYFNQSWRRRLSRQKAAVLTAVGLLVSQDRHPKTLADVAVGLGWPSRHQPHFGRNGGYVCSLSNWLDFV